MELWAPLDGGLDTATGSSSNTRLVVESGDALVRASTYYLLLRESIGFTALWGAIEKLRSLSSYIDGVGNYGLLPGTIAPAVAVAVLAGEVVVSVLLVSGFFAVAGAALALCLFAAFAVAIGVNLARDNRAPCLCFGASESERISIATLLRSITLLIMSAFALWLALIDPPEAPSDTVVPTVISAAGIAAILRLSGFMSEVVEYLRAPAGAFAAMTSRTSFRHLPLTVPLRTPLELQSPEDVGPVVAAAVDDSPGVQGHE